MQFPAKFAPSRREAFTLVELSIVLVILGLLIGGVLTGQSLIRAAELRSVSTQYSRYVTAVQTFRDKYFALPGDMTNAQAYWGIQNATPGSCVTSASTDAKTCNGDGDGKISYSAAGSNEDFRFWQHLANAGLIEGSYSGVQQGGTLYSATLLNSPAGKISSSLWFAADFGAMASNAQIFNGQYDNSFEFGGTVTNSDPIAPILKPEDAYNIDTKMDDGKPATGKIVIRTNSSWAAETCTDTATYTTLTANYLLTNSALTCALMFRQAF